jgi:hypothetical protein
LITNQSWSVATISFEVGISVESVKDSLSFKSFTHAVSHAFTFFDGANIGIQLSEAWNNALAHQVFVVPTAFFQFKQVSVFILS